MATIVGQELKNWKDSLAINELDDYDITVANIILENYEELQQAGGTYGGKRASKFAELVNAKKDTCDAELVEITVGSSSRGNRIKRIKALEVESFRGFATSRTFELGKQYVLLYGPNGSGKTSFSEALEYGLLGSIEEADVDKIKLTTYIKNTYTKKGVAPIIRCIYEDGSEGIAETDYDVNRFAFVEKNRITDFSHISSLTSKNQSERIAALFGLSEFTNFVKGFSKNCDEKYLPTQSTTEQSFKEQQAVREAKNAELVSIQGELGVLEQSANDSLQLLSKEKADIKTLKQAIDYYDDINTGILTLKLQEKDKNTVKLIKSDIYKDIKNLSTAIDAEFEEIILLRDQLSNKALEVNYKQLYETISNLDESEYCPACGTPIVSAVRNPYAYAKEQLSAYEEIDGIKKNIHEHANISKKNIEKLKLIIDDNKELIKLLMEDSPELEPISCIEIEKMDESVDSWIGFVHSIISLDDDAVDREIITYNEKATKKNDTYSKEIEDLQCKEKALLTLQTQINEKQRAILDSKLFIDTFDKNSAATLLKIDKEKKTAEYNSKIVVAYKKIIENLYAYTEKLPELIAQDLEEKIVEYYNVINQGDSEFEMLSDISLPVGDSSEITLSFKDGSSSNALQILSEGHVKILGLAILLAKAIKDGLNFIIFDDIVNAIDDEHRNGVADLIITHNDFKDVQIILSTHGDQFIMKLKDRLGESKCSRDSYIYKFLPADSLTERGVIVEYSDSKTPIEAAKKKFDDNELKDAASKCRQAMECISYNLWGKISKTSNGEINVAMKSPKTQPDLYSITDALIKKSKKIEGMEPITQNLEVIKQQANWRILNKGTHFEDEQPEFDRADVKVVLDTLVALDTQVRELKIKETAV